MKKMFMLFAVVLGFGMTTVHAADATPNPKLEEAKELRVQATKARMQAEDLTKRANELELEAVKNETKSGDKQRGGNYNCFSDCLRYNHGDGYSCKRSCGYY